MHSDKSQWIPEDNSIIKKSNQLVLLAENKLDRANRSPFDTSEIDLRTYIEALEYMAVRTGTAVPTGAAEKALAFLCQHTDHLWPFLQEELLGNHLGGDKKGGKYGSSENKSLGEKLLPLESIGSGTELSLDFGGSSWAARGTDGQRGAPRDMLGKSIVIDCANKMYPLARVSAALEAFVIAFGDDGVAPGDFPLQDLTNFLYLGGQTKVETTRRGVEPS